MGRKPERFRRRVPSLSRRHANGIVGGLIVTLMVVGTIASPVLAPQDPVKLDLRVRLLPPAFVDGGHREQLLGTDGLGRDILSRILYGGRVSLVVGTSSVLVAGAFGVIVGLVGGFYGRLPGAVVSLAVDVQLSIPFLALAVGVIALMQPSLALIVLVLSINGWAPYARVVRGQVLSVKEKEFIEAARAIGASGWRIMFVHVLPNIRNAVIVIGTLQVGTMILLESALSYLGIGVQPPAISWGAMVADGRDYLATSWWIATFPGVAILLTVLGINLLGDWLRDLTDPRLRGAAGE